MNLAFIFLVIMVTLTGLTGCLGILLRYYTTYYHPWKNICFYAILYFATSFFNWLNLLFSICFREYLIITNTIWCFTVMLNPVFLFRIIDSYTEGTTPVLRRLFSYIIPVGSILSIFIILLSKPAFSPGNALSFMLEGGPVAMLISVIGSAYMCLNLYMLRHHLKENRNENADRDRKEGVPGILCGICIILLVMSPLWFVYLPPDRGYMILTGILMLAFSMLHIFLATRLIETGNEPEEAPEVLYKKENSEYIADRKTEGLPVQIPSGTKSVSATLPLTKRCFHDWIKRNKPYLNPELRIDELASMYGVSVRELSGFLNREYQMNFNRYINRCRLTEIRQLKAKNKDARLTQLVSQAGFGSMISYNRAKASFEKEKEQI